MTASNQVEYQGIGVKIPSPIKNNTKSLIGKFKIIVISPILKSYLNGVGAAFLGLPFVRSDMRDQSHSQIKICQHHFLNSW